MIIPKLLPTASHIKYKSSCSNVLIQLVGLNGLLGLSVLVIAAKLELRRVREPVQVEKISDLNTAHAMVIQHFNILPLLEEQTDVILRINATTFTDLILESTSLLTNVSVFEYKG